MPLRVITRRARFWSTLVLIAAFSLWNAYWTIQKKKRNSEQFLGIISCGTNTVTEKQDLSNSSTTMVRWAADLNNALDPGRLRALALQLRSNYSSVPVSSHGGGRSVPAVNYRGRRVRKPRIYRCRRRLPSWCQVFRGEKHAISQERHRRRK